MKVYRTYIITKKTLLRAGFVLLVIIAFVIALFMAAQKRETKTVTAFSDIAQSIMDEGVISEENEVTLKEITTQIVGFDTGDAGSIIKSSTPSFQMTQSSVPSPVPQTQTQSTQAPEKNLPAHDQICSASGLKINNATNYEVDIDMLCSQPLDIKLELAEPEVLIVHTHTTECYNGDEMTGESERTTNEAYNMCKIGEIIAGTLDSYGIKTVHDKTIHDYPSYQGSYTRAQKTIESNLSKYPSIKVVLDIHRDAYNYPDGTKLSVSTDINGSKTAQVMLVLGTDSMGLSHPFWQSNLTLAAKIQNTAQMMYPGIMRPVNLRRERFNMHLTKGSILLEIGSNGNTLEEAVSAAEKIANSIAAVLLNG